MRALLLVTLLAAVGCSDSPVGLATNELRAAEGRWRASGIRDYTYNVQRVCFCASTPTLEVTVRNGAFLSAKNVDAGAPTDTALYGDYLTIDKLFSFLDRSLAQKPAKFDGTYDGALGYPIRVEIDPVLNAVDEEVTIIVSGFRTP